MTWVRLDDGFAQHPKLLSVGALGVAMQVAALCYCNRYLTDGFVPAAAVENLLNLDAIDMHVWRGEMIGGALVGTFLGVFLAYGLVGPMAVRLKEVVDEDSAMYRIIRSVLVAHLHGNAAQISVEIGRGSVPSPSQPSFAQLEEALGNIPAEAA